MCKYEKSELADSKKSTAAAFLSIFFVRISQDAFFDEKQLGQCTRCKFALNGNEKRVIISLHWGYC